MATSSEKPTANIHGTKVVCTSSVGHHVQTNTDAKKFNVRETTGLPVNEAKAISRRIIMFFICDVYRSGHSTTLQSAGTSSLQHKEATAAGYDQSVSVMPPLVILKGHSASGMLGLSNSFATRSSAWRRDFDVKPAARRTRGKLQRNISFLPTKR